MDRKIEKKTFTPKRIAYASVTILFFGAVFYNLVFGDRSSKLNVDSERITISEVSYGPFVESIVLPGTVIPKETVMLTALEGGRVVERFMLAGREVEEGEPILLLENTDLRIQIMTNEANYTETSNRVRQVALQVEQNSINVQRSIIDMEHQLRLAKREYERQKDLIEKNATSRQLFEDAEYNYEYYKKRIELAIESNRIDSLFRESELKQMRASLLSMDENLAFVRTKLENLTVRAPVTGYLTALNAELGEQKARGQEIGRVDVMTGFKIECNPDEYYLSRISGQLNGNFILPNSETQYFVKLERVFPQVLNGAFRIWLQFEEEPPGIRNGQTIRVNLELGSPLEAVLIPKGGFYSSTGGQWVYVVDPSGDFAVQRRVRIGRQNPQNYEVIEGLEPGERVITSSYDNFGDIDKLILKNQSN